MKEERARVKLSLADLTVLMDTVIASRAFADTAATPFKFSCESRIKLGDTLLDVLSEIELNISVDGEDKGEAG